MKAVEGQDAVKKIERNFERAVEAGARDERELAAAQVLAALYADALLDIYGVPRPSLNVAKLAEAYKQS